MYLLFAGLLDEIYQDTGMLSGGPFDLDTYQKTADILLQAMLADSTVLQKEKGAARKDFEFCDTLYCQYRSQNTVDVTLLRTTYLEKRKRIDAIARKLLRS